MSVCLCIPVSLCPRVRPLQLRKQRLKERIEADVGALVQFLLDERDALLDGLDAEEVATNAVLDDNLKTVKAEAAAVDATIADVNDHIAGKTSFEVGRGPTLSVVVLLLFLCRRWSLVKSQDQWVTFFRDISWLNKRERFSTG